MIMMRRRRKRRWCGAFRRARGKSFTKGGEKLKMMIRRRKKRRTERRGASEHGLE